MEKTKLKTGNAFLEARKKSMAAWSGVSHRLELIGSHKGVDFINDSKATDVESVSYAFEAIEQPIIWLCGNSRDAEKFNALEKDIKYKVVSIYCFGSELHWQPGFEKWVEKCENHTSLETAFVRAVQSAQPGSALLLSPGNADYDIFKNYKDRGDTFKNLVEEWVKFND